MRLSSLRFGFVIVAAASFANCNCGEVLEAIPTPEVGILNEDGDVHKDADPWMVVAFGDADTGQNVTRNLKVKNIGGGTLHISQACLVNAADLETAIRADTQCLGSGVAPFVFPVIIGQELKAEATVDLPVTFKPVAGGPASVFLRIGSDANKEPLAAVQLTGRGTDGTLCADPAVVDFGRIAVGTTATQQVTISNCGVKPVTLDTFAFANNPDSAFGFSVAGAAPALPMGPLEGGASFVVDVTFTPPQPQPYRDARAGDVRITTQAPFAAIYDILLLGTGIEPPSCRVNVVPQTVNFGGVASNTTQTRQIIVQSVGQCACSITGFAGPTPGDANFSIPSPPALPFVLKGTTGCEDDVAGAATAPSVLTVDVNYTSPDRAEPIADRATVEVTTDAEVDPVRVVNLEANGGGAPFCQIHITPETSAGSPFGQLSKRYGVVEFGRSSINITKRLPIVLENVGNADCHVSGVEFDKEANTVANEFSLQTDSGANGIGTAPFTLGPAQTRTFFAVFSPTHTTQSDNPFDVFSFGSYSASLGTGSAFSCGIGGPNLKCNGIAFITDDTVTDMEESSAVPGRFSIGFSATPVEPSVDIIPPELDFGLVTLDCGSPERRTTIYNTGSLPLKVGQPVVDPATNPPTFSVTATSNPGDSPTNDTSGWPFTLEPGESMAVSVRYFARELGLQTGLMIIPTFEEENGSQVDGPPLTVPLQGEGTLDREQTDIFDQARDPTVDVLFVIDDSGSMGDDQALLGQNFPQFFTSSNVDDADYHIAVTTTLSVGPNCVDLNGSTCADDDMSGTYTSCSDGGERFLTPTSPDPEGQFECNINVSTPRGTPGISDCPGCFPRRPGSSAESGLRAAYNFLSPPKINDPAFNGGFMRDNAKLHVIIVSDEPDQSRGGTDLYIDFFQNLKGFRNSSLVAVSAIALADNERCPQDPDGNVGSARYEEVVSALNGRFQSFCEQDWSGSMRALGLDSLGLQVEFFLTRAATAETLEVCVRNGSTTVACTPATQVAGPGANGYFYDDVNNSIVFNPGSVPPRGSRVEAHYETFCFGP